MRGLIDSLQILRRSSMGSFGKSVNDLGVDSIAECGRVSAGCVQRFSLLHYPLICPPVDFAALSFKATALNAFSQVHAVAKVPPLRDTVKATLFYQITRRFL